MNLQIAINQISILFIIMFIGLIAKKKNIINKNVEKSLSDILLYISLPALSISSVNMQYDSNTLPHMVQILIVTCLSYVAVIAFATITAKLFKLESPLSNVYIALIVFANTAFMGYPMASAFFGEIGIFYATVVNLVFGLFIWTYGILLIDKNGTINFKKLFNIGTISAALTIFLFSFNIKLPFVLHSALEMTGKITTPLSMILIGAFIADMDSIKRFTDWRILLISFFRLLVIPLATGLVLKFLDVNKTIISFCVLMAAMPSAATNAIFAKEFNAEPFFASIGVFVTTLLFLGSLPIVIFILINFIL